MINTEKNIKMPPAMCKYVLKKLVKSCELKLFQQQESCKNDFNYQPRLDKHNWDIYIYIKK